MNVKIKLFASHRELTGKSELTIDVPNGASVSDVFAALAVRYPMLADTAPFTSFARNRQIVERTELLADGDELALLQPVSGGSDSAIDDELIVGGRVPWRSP